MKRRRTNVILATLVLIVAFGIWYFFIKRWDYKILFTVPVTHSVAYTFIHDHHEWDGKTLKNGQLTFSEKEPWTFLSSQLNLDSSIYLFDWKLKAKNDSLTKISLGVSDARHSLRNRWSVLFKKTAFEKNIRKNVIIIRDKIIERNNEFKYSKACSDSMESIPCVYISTKSPVRGKANEMIRNVISLNLFVKEHKLGLNGNPMVVVKNWNPLSDSIDFDFCFPVLHPELIPEDDLIKSRTVSVKKALRIDFFGNYSYTDYSWNQLFEAAHKQSANPTGRIIEVFYNDPHSGENDLNWKASVYMELAE